MHTCFPAFCPCRPQDSQAGGGGQVAQLAARVRALEAVRIKQELEIQALRWGCVVLVGCCLLLCYLACLQDACRRGTGSVR